MKNSSYRSHKRNFWVVVTVFSLIFGVSTLPSGNGTAQTAGADVTTLAGDGTAGFADGQGTSAKFNKPIGIAVDNAGNVYAADSINHRIRKIDSTGRVTTLAGTGIVGRTNGPGASAKFINPFDVAIDNTGNVYVADGTHLIRKIDSKGNVSTLAGTEDDLFVGGFADGKNSSAKFNMPQGITVDNTGNVYVSDTFNNRIRKIDSKGNVTTFAGDGTAGFADGQRTSAKFNAPCGIAVDNAGNIYVADRGNIRIRKIDSTGNVTTFAGDGTKGFADGQRTSAKFDNILGIAADNAGNLYATDASRIRKIDSRGNVTTIAGDGTAGFADGQRASARFNAPWGIAVDNAGNIYVAEYGNNRIRKINQAASAKGAGVGDKDDQVKLGEFIGTVGGFEGSNIIVNGKDTIGRQAPIGRTLVVDANGQYIYLQSTFPMQTVVKCKVTSGDRTQIKKGMKVYLKP